MKKLKKQKKKENKEKKPKKEKKIEETKEPTKLNDITKKLQRLVENRKTPRVVSKQESYKPGSKGSRVSNSSSGGDYYGGSEEEY